MDMTVIHYSSSSLSESNVLVGTHHYFLATHSNTFTWLNVSILLSVVVSIMIHFVQLRQQEKQHHFDCNSVLTLSLTFQD